MPDGPRHTSSGAVVIGGVGGSGTRAVAGVLRACGLTLPEPLNPQLDSQWADVLFKLPRRRPLLAAADRTRPVSELVEAVGVLVALLRGVRLDERGLFLLAAAAVEYSELGRRGPIAGARWPAPATAFELIAEYLARPRPLEVPDRWGWKHPVNQLLLPELDAAIAGLRYVHVVRDPLDAAWSGNSQGVALWGALAGVEAERVGAAPADARLAWWLHTTRHAVMFGRQAPDRFLLVRLEQLCAHPLAVARRLAAFAGLTPGERTLRDAAATVVTPPSIGRWRAHSLDELDPDRLRAAREWVANWEA